MPACGSNRRQCDPLDHRDSQKPVVPSCWAKEILKKRFEVEHPANTSQKTICPPSRHLLKYITRRLWSLLSLLGQRGNLYITGGDAGASGGRLEQALKAKRFWCSGEVKGW